MYQYYDVTEVNKFEKDKKKKKLLFDIYIYTHKTYYQTIFLVVALTFSWFI